MRHTFGKHKIMLKVSFESVKLDHEMAYNFKYSGLLSINLIISRVIAKDWKRGGDNIETQVLNAYMAEF